MKYKVFIDNKPINIIEADETFMLSNYPEGNYELLHEVFEVNQSKHITVGAFFDRLGSNKWSILSDTNPQIQALIKDCSVRKYINLEDAQLQVGLNLIVSAGYSLDVDSILNSEITPMERA